ncbi:bifunctional riboflavin kinase/FAD synthetase [Ichthyenterobacterium sp. W332]|uniref:Riboflavin biosynthesis protein n=1 Tax=Microcosmobacter mediterraneus TaxID=3075607 RepID=A0ABU2YIC9_9FLAO|nr:bifunctional riboflavin kinase/FAD synthetase [Ichthyenterobacterium sp. W332]MDT0557929.1 bifunctional riboflavin kinase/FAD synthetase [Ichthyenterobacterium sp. W332]
MSNLSNKLEHSVITIGTFDGVHIGHQKIIEQLLSVANKQNLKPVVLTFFPHPRMVIQPDFKMELLNTIDEKRGILLKLGIEELVIKRFTKKFASLTARAYVEEILVKELKIKHVIIGYDHRFGKGRLANIENMKSLGSEFNFTVQEIPAQDISDITVSSTKIRKALAEGNLELANRYLGYNYFLSGTIIKGRGLGKTIQFPTANISISEDYKLIPKQGVYVVTSKINGLVVKGMMNIGTNPTVKGKTQSIEVHFFNFNQDLYSKNLKIDIVHRLRDEQKFESLQALSKQLEQDKKDAIVYLNNNN